MSIAVYLITTPSTVILHPFKCALRQIFVERICDNMYLSPDRPTTAFFVEVGIMLALKCGQQPMDCGNWKINYERKVFQRQASTMLSKCVEYHQRAFDGLNMTICTNRSLLQLRFELMFLRLPLFSLLCHSANSSSGGSDSLGPSRGAASGLVIRTVLTAAASNYGENRIYSRPLWSALLISNSFSPSI